MKPPPRSSRARRSRILLVLAVPLWLAYGALYGLVGWWDELRDALASARRAMEGK